MDNQRLRDDMRTWRENLSEDDVQRKSKQVMDQILSHLDVEAYDSFLCFYPFRNEVDLRPLYEKLLKLGYCLYFPVTHDGHMQFYQVDSLLEFSPGGYGILEPTGERMWEDGGNTFAFVPGLCFSKSGERVGFGAGYYDRFFAEHMNITRVGVCFAGQLSSEITVMEWDIPMNAVVCDAAVYMIE